MNHASTFCSIKLAESETFKFRTMKIVVLSNFLRFSEIKVKTLEQVKDQHLETFFVIDTSIIGKSCGLK